jgi:hypothetical protein
LTKKTDLTKKPSEPLGNNIGPKFRIELRLFDGKMNETKD